MKSQAQPPKSSTSYIDSTIEYIASTAIARTATLAYNFFCASKLIQQNNLVDNIIPGLFLGVIPVESSTCGSGCTNSHQRIVNLIRNTPGSGPLDLVVSAVTYEETQGKGFFGFNITKPSTWFEDADINQTLVPINDRPARIDMDDDRIIGVTNEIKQCIDNGKSVFVHCKAGRERSATICAIYLTLYGGEYDIYTLEQAIEFLKMKRIQVDLTDPLIHKARLVLKRAKEIDAKSIVSDDKNSTILLTPP